MILGFCVLGILKILGKPQDDPWLVCFKLIVSDSFPSLLPNYRHARWIGVPVRGM